MDSGHKRPGGVALLPLLENFSEQFDV